MPSALAEPVQLCTRLAWKTATGSDAGFPTCLAPATAGQSGHQITSVRARSGGLLGLPMVCPFLSPFLTRIELVFERKARIRQCQENGTPVTTDRFAPFAAHRSHRHFFER